MTLAQRRWVLDTNVVIDWLVFNHPFMDPLRNAVRDGSLQVLTHGPAIDELRRVLAYRQLKLNAERQQQVLDAYLASALAVTLPAGATLKNLMMPGGFPRCRDRDDEHFVALAYHHRADALVSRDNAVYGMKSRAAKFGLEIVNVQQAIGLLSPQPPIG
jgi:putative PIN family toxin of toxin-antitoxin system